MKILSTNNNYSNSTGFKSTYPVYHWVAESNGSYAPISNLKLAKKLQGKIIRILNKPLDESKKCMNPVHQNLRAYIGRCDADYRTNAVVRSFYNREEANLEGNSPVVYALSGDTLQEFEDSLAKIIGTKKHEAISLGRDAHSPEAIEAIKSYNTNGLAFVNDLNKRIKDKISGMTYALHTKFMIIRSKSGKIKDYQFVDARFLPEKGPNSPFERLK